MDPPLASAAPVSVRFVSFARVHDILKTNEPTLMQIDTICSRGEGWHEAINFRGQEVKGQGHIRPK